MLWHPGKKSDRSAHNYKNTIKCSTDYSLMWWNWHFSKKIWKFNAVWSNDRAAHTDTNPKNLELAPPQSIKATRLDQLVYSPNYYIQIFQT